MNEHIDRIVTFSVGQEIRHAKAMRWKKFLMKADGRAPVQHPDPEDLATIRYTSGTTGEPKGVTFNFGQLVWMGEVMTNLLSWEDRNRPLRYLSFLPLSHVVEGILASYAPYYLLANVDYFYLNDFGSLTEALPKVRPTVFFSVPRFYEKVWDQVSANKIGQVWLSAKDGPAKKALGMVLRRAVLRKAGIDKCRQLIVGSAPVSEALLLHFRELGIEVYNAYGQTEAPLITAYGKNISITKLEARLKDIPGVSEAVLIGENRPYCTALIWLENDVPDLAEKIEHMNANLSHPEQIRKYKVISKPLSIQAGELTPNLKVKRGNVEEHLAEKIAEMYR